MQLLLSRSCRAIFVIEREMKRERVPVVFTGGAKFRSYWWKLARKTVVKIATSRYYTFFCIGIAYNFSNRRDYTSHRGYVLRFVYIDYRKSRGNSFLLSYNLANFIEENDPIFDQNSLESDPCVCYSLLLHRNSRYCAVFRHFVYSSHTFVSRSLNLSMRFAINPCTNLFDKLIKLFRH